MNDNTEMFKLSADQQEAVRKVTGLARKAAGRHTLLISSGEAYAYQSGDEIHWGFNAAPSFQNTARGVVPL
jgi:hypothetical protein